MADDTRQANVVLTAETQQYSQQMAAASAQTNAMADSVNKLFASIEKLQRATVRRLEIISASAIGGITAATVAAAKFEQQMGQLQASAAITGKNINATTKAVNELRTSLPVSTEQVIQLVGALQKMGASQSNVQKLADTFIKLGAATGEDIGALATNLVSLQRAMGTTEGATKGFSDQVAHLSATLGVSATGILQFANNLAPVARTVGMTQTQVMGFSAAFVKAGQDGYAAANVFNKMTTDIARAVRYGSNDIYAYANAVGMTAEQFKKLPAADQATSFFNAVSRQGGEAIKTLERLGYDGPRALKAIQGLAQSGGLNQALNESQKGFNSGATEKGAKASMDGLNDSLKKLQNTLTSIAQTFGTTFLKPVTAAIEGVNKLANVIRNALQPFNALLGMMGLSGGAAAGALGAGIQGFGALSTAALAYMALRNPLTAGFRAARAARTGGPMSAFTKKTAESYAAGKGSPWQRRFMGFGMRMANLPDQFRGGPMLGPQTPQQMMRSSVGGMFGGGIRTLVPRIGAGLSGLYAGAMGLASQSLEPLQFKAINDATKRPMNAFAPMRQAWSAMRTGEAAGATGMRAAAAATGTFVKAIFSATAGLGRLTVSTASASMGLQGLGFAGGAKKLGGMALGGIGKAGGAMMGLMGGLPGLALMAGIGGFAYAGSLNNQAKDFRDRLSSGNSEDSAVNQYASSMGLAGSAAMTFAQTVNQATKTIQVDTIERAKRIAPVDVAAANMPGREMTNKALEKMTEAQATQYASTVFGVESTDPKIMAEMKYDLINRFQQKGAERIIKQAESGKDIDLGSMVTDNHTYNDWGRSLFRPSAKLKDQLSTVESSYGNLASYTQNQMGSKETGKLTTATVNSLLKEFTGTTSNVQQQALLSTIEQIIGEGNLNLGVGDTEAISNGKTVAERRKALVHAIEINAERNEGVGQGFLDMYGEQTSAQQNASTYNLPKAGDNSLYRSLGVYSTQAGAMLRTDKSSPLKLADQPIATAVQSALREPDNANKQLQAATQWGAAMVKNTGDTVAASTELQRLKAAIKDTEDPLYKMASAAQQAVKRLEGYQATYQSRGANARTTARSLVDAYGSQGPDSEQNIIANEDQYEAARAGAYEQFKNVVKAYREFDIQQDRAAKDFAKQRQRSDDAFYLQKAQSQEDHDIQLERSQESYDRQRMRGQEAYDLQRKQSQDDFDKQRHRSEEDFAHQVEQQARQMARGIQNIYERINTKPSWDAQNLVTNSNDQLSKMRKQQADLAKVREMGLSSDAIGQLGLNEFGNQQQLARMVADFGNNPELIAQLNESIAGRIDMGKIFTTDPDSDSWKEMQRSFKLAADRAVEDFNQMAQRGAAAYELGLNQMQEDYTRVTEEGEKDYKKMVQRQNVAYALSVKQTVSDWNEQTARAKEDMNRSFEEVTGSFNEMANEALSRLTGVTADQYTELKTSLGLSSEEIKAALTKTNDDTIKLLAPLFGGEEGARQALARAADKRQSESDEWLQKHNMQARRQGVMEMGGGNGSEASYDSMSGGGGVGGAGGMNFPLPAGSWHKTSNFGMRVNPVSGVYRLHAGTDLAAPAGTPIGAAEDGVVTKASVMGGLGNMVELTHSGGIKTWYGHMSHITAQMGQLVEAGQEIGKVGSTGNSTGNHLHFERHINGNAVDPWGYLQGLTSGVISGITADNYIPGLGVPGMDTDVTKLKGVQQTEKSLMNLTPGGLAYTPGLFATALQSRVDSFAGMPQDAIGGRGGSYGTSPSGRVGARGSYVRGGVPMGTSSITTIQHIDQGTDYNGGIVVMAQDPEEMGRKLAEKKRMKALTRPSRSA